MIKDFEQEDIIHLDLLDCYGVEPYTREVILSLREAPNVYRKTLLSVRGEVLAVFGGFATYKYMELWAAAGKAIKKYPKTYHKSMLEQMNYVTEKYGLVRLQSKLFADNIAAQKQHEAWGFEFEGILKKAGPNGADMMMYAKVVE